VRSAFTSRHSPFTWVGTTTEGSLE